MTSELTRRNYSIPDANLALFASNLVGFLTRDLDDFEIFGLTEDKIQDLRDQVDDFEEIDTDGAVVAGVLLASQTKNELREQVLEEIRRFALRAEIMWGSESPFYKGMDIGYLSKLNDAELLRSARIVHNRVSTWVTTLSDLGLTLELVNTYNNMVQSFENSLNELAEKQADRELKKQERISAGNQLYKLVYDYCSMGKRLYDGTNPAKYNEYVIYTTGAGSLSKPEGLLFNIPNKLLTWMNVENATSYSVEVSSDGINYQSAYTGSDTQFTYNETIESSIFFKIRARNSNGYGEYSDVLSVLFSADMAYPTNLVYSWSEGLIMWDAVANASFYELVYRKANSLENWINIYSGAANEKFYTLADGVWELKVRAANATIGSLWSPVRLVTVPLPSDGNGDTGAS